MPFIQLPKSESDIFQLKLFIDKMVSFANELFPGQIKLYIKMYLLNFFIIFLKDNLNHLKIHFSQT